MVYLEKEQEQAYEEKGFLFLDRLLDRDKIEAITAKVAANSWQDKPGNVWESDGETLRGIHEDPTKDGLLEKISKHPDLVEPAMQILGSQVYLYQLKINFKAAFSGDVWPWHQDYIYWQQEDGMPTPRAVNVMVFLDEVNEFNEPLCLIPGSHKEGVISSLSPTQEDAPHSEKSEWEESFKSDLKYTASEKVVTKLVEKNGIESPKGKAGSALFFHPNCVHGSANNISPYSRKVAIITYNSVKNVPLPVDNPRPNFLVGRDYSPIKPLPN